MTGHLDPAGMDQAELDRYGLGAAALRYQRMGYAVLALGAGSKRPHHLFASGDGSPAGVHWATRDPVMVQYVWSRDRLAGVGVATGQASQLLVIDLDVKGEQDGRAGFDSFTEAWSLPMPQSAPRVATPSGGEHIWLRLPYGLAVPGRLGILPGVDIKADGGYVAVPPSKVWTVSAADGQQVLLPYRMTGCPCSVPWAPSWLIDWIWQTPGSGTGSGGTGQPVPELNELVQDGIPVGERNDTLHRVACSLYRRNNGNDAAVRAQLQPLLQATGLPGREVDRLLASARRFVQRSQQAREAGWREQAQSGWWRR